VLSGEWGDEGDVALASLWETLARTRRVEVEGAGEMSFSALPLCTWSLFCPIPHAQFLLTFT